MSDSTNSDYRYIPEYEFIIPSELQSMIHDYTDSPQIHYSSSPNEHSPQYFRSILSSTMIAGGFGTVIVRLDASSQVGYAIVLDRNGDIVFGPAPVAGRAGYLNQASHSDNPLLDSSKLGGHTPTGLTHFKFRASSKFGPYGQLDLDYPIDGEFANVVPVIRTLLRLHSGKWLNEIMFRGTRGCLVMSDRDLLSLFSTLAETISPDLTVYSPIHRLHSLQETLQPGDFGMIITKNDAIMKAIAKDSISSFLFLETIQKGPKAVHDNLMKYRKSSIFQNEFYKYDHGRYSVGDFFSPMNRRVFP